MARLIDADAFIERFKKAKTLCAAFPPEMREVLIGMYDEFIEEIGNQPTVDAVEVVHGRWQFVEQRFYHGGFVNLFRCSECKVATDRESSYCPNCGAKMDGERKDNDSF